MKRLLLSILPVFLVLAAFGQDDGLNRAEGPVENGPVIININAYKLDNQQYIIPRVEGEYIKEELPQNLSDSDAGMFTNSSNNSSNQHSSAQEGSKNIEQQVDVTQEGTSRFIDEVKNEMKVYPIPAATDLNVSLGQEVNAELNLMNILGQTVYSFTADDLSNHTISVNNYPSGTYFLVIKIDNERITKRVQIR